MKRKAIAITAVVCGILCAATVLVYMRDVQAQAQAVRSDALERYGGETVQACVATRDIQPGETVSAANATMRQWLVDMLPADAATSLEEVADKKVASRILAGEVVSLRRFEGESTSVSVPDGLQAVSIELGSAPALGELLQAGAVVDVYATGATTTLIASHVLVAAIETGSYSGKCVTLAIDPQKVQEVIAASQQTGIYLALPSTGGAENQAAAESQGDAANQAASSQEPQDRQSQAQEPQAQEPQAQEPQAQEPQGQGFSIPVSSEARSSSSSSNERRPA